MKGFYSQRIAVEWSKKKNVIFSPALFHQVAEMLWEARQKANVQVHPQPVWEWSDMHLEKQVAPPRLGTRARL